MGISEEKPVGAWYGSNNTAENSCLRIERTEELCSSCRLKEIARIMY